MAISLAPVIKQRYLDANGNPLAGGKLYSYQAGTTTPQATYTDSTGGTANANPVVLDANGEANVWVDNSLSYKFILKDSSDVVQWTVDNVTSDDGESLPQWSATQPYDAGDIVADASGSGLLYVSLQDNNLNNALTDVSYWRVFDGNVRTIATSGSALVTDNIIRANSTSGAITVTLPSAAATPIGKVITIKDVGNGSYTTSVKGYSSETIDGSNTYTTALRQYDSLTVKNNGTTWDAVMDVTPTSAKVPIGTILSFAGATVPTGFLFCDGAQVSRTTYAALDAAIGETWGSYTNGSGGSGTTHLRLPNLLNRFLRGAGAAGDGNGGDTVNLGAYQADELKSHTHGIALNMGSPGASTIAFGTAPVAVDATQNSNATGGNETRPKSYGVQWIIKY